MNLILLIVCSFSVWTNNALFAAHYGKLTVLIGMKVSKLHLLDETLAYSLSNKKAATKVFIVEYEPTMKGSLEEISLEDLISRFAFTY